MCEDGDDVRGEVCVADERDEDEENLARDNIVEC